MRTKRRAFFLPGRSKLRSDKVRKRSFPGEARRRHTPVLLDADDADAGSLVI